MSFKAAAATHRSGWMASMRFWPRKLKTSLRKRSDYRDVRQAAAYLMRVRNSYSSSGRSFACQPFSVRTLFTQIWEMSRRLENVIIEQQSFEVLIPHYDREDSFFYGDPPYYDSEYVYDAEFGCFIGSSSFSRYRLSSPPQEPSGRPDLDFPQSGCAMSCATRAV